MGKISQLSIFEQSLLGGESKITEETINEIQEKIQMHDVPNSIPIRKVKIIVPITEDISKEFEIDAPAQIVHHDELLEYFGTYICGVDAEAYFENVKNNLPTWDLNQLLPERIQDHILSHHTLKGRIGVLLNDFTTECAIKGEYSLNGKEYKQVINNLISKLNNGANLNDMEEGIATILTERDNKDHFPRNMSKRQIINAIHEAYIDARKISKRQFPTERDKENVDDKIRGSVMYQGKSGDMVIHFWFHFDDMEIGTAYPVFKKPKSIRQDKLKNKKR